MSHLEASLMRSAKVSNGQLSCRAPGCPSHRYAVQPFCKVHFSRNRKYGSPLGGPLDHRQWAQERLQVQELFAGHPDHPGLVSVLAWVTSWMAKASEAVNREKPPKGTEELARLARYGVSALDVVTEACAFNVWESRNARRCPDDRAWTFALARSVFRLAPRPRRNYRPETRSAANHARPSYELKAHPRDVEAVGTELQATLAPFFVTVCGAMEQRDQQKVQILEAMRAPFDAPRAALVAEVSVSEA